ncbi:DUF4229 domain-containing protein [Microbacterium sp. zg.B48]|uniref:DUF4229 domain-containing protein n=1 Tax=unclassified Microbacterium TaxID=2609290 RepID=UPI00214B9570|nr:MULTISPECIES: DUF4229 domain-containing protein [unclassified Microbacterium]MCR2764590.1 DUF4229 domain-containing protein [Microbacterium sp. zg.B48]MCR2810820.1 DUF4229 domain-containing protein [Microbacterium sp. zg.B185]WIM19774.1 DUF4229 domain-containing protein [Microbacterium sp. zg-B185]
MKARSALVYTALRLLAFLVPFGILMIFPVFRELYWLAAVFAALIGLSLSLLFLRRPLTEVTTELAQRRAKAKAAASDEDVEDAMDRDAPSRLSADEGPQQERAVGD